MPKAREELRRGVRNLIEVASREMDALDAEAPPAPQAPEVFGDERPDRPILRLVREPGPAATPVVDEPARASAPAPPVQRVPAPTRALASAPPAPVLHGIPADASGVHPRRGVCAAYYVNHACWEVPEAPCNQALHVCMLRDCPVYNLNRDELERRFAAKFAHLW
ncbi:MAG: hypothetical protein QN174_07025 [Armatimonadota bacterium]|nr:hypothetical protein [Armatimonadota bacterium]MDR7423458.1 hypothetical protein [Armatimonadota bacterium]MDR7453729.1 hypothetical protein [Armatimonadota bacterium]MDR7456397.1 hypothetical protein [Armatimonadota bacterium]MDR7496693.1 hypothetical protein [Armatimonadota bacterium]